MTLPSTPDPSRPSAIHTDTSGLRTGDAVITTTQGPLPLHWSAPDAPGPHPVILVIQEIFGVDHHMQDLTRRLARQGYLAVAPALYARLGDPSQAQSIDDLLQRFVALTPDAQVLADLDAALAWSGEHGGDAAQIGATGFCWGGRITWLYAAHQPRLKAAVAWYGRLTGRPGALHPHQPLQLAARLHCPVLGLYAGQDSGISLDSVSQMQDALAAAASTSRIHLYPDAPHGFFNDQRSSHRPDLAQDGWARLLDWFARHGVRG